MIVLKIVICLLVYFMTDIVNPCQETDVNRITQQTQNICITFLQSRPNVYDVGPALY